MLGRGLHCLHVATVATNIQLSAALHLFQYHAIATGPGGYVLTIPARHILDMKLMDK